MGMIKSGSGEKKRRGRGGGGDGRGTVRSFISDSELSVGARSSRLKERKA